MAAKYSNVQMKTLVFGISIRHIDGRTTYRVYLPLQTGNLKNILDICILI